MSNVAVTVHRGTHQIGGCCTEIATDTTRILIDFGMNLPGVDGKQLNIDGATNSRGKKCDAIFVTHYHGDHIGELGEVSADVPIYMGDIALDIQKAYQDHMSAHLELKVYYDNFIQLYDAQKVVIGDVSVTPILSDHSAFQSFMFLIDAAGKRMLHTGDFRLHGENASKLLEKLAAIGHIDMLISEGTTLSRKDAAYKTEDDVKAEFKKIIKQYKYTFLLASSSNIERLESFASAIPRRKYLLADDFQKNVFKIVQQHNDTYKYYFDKTLEPGNNLRCEEWGFGRIIRANTKTKEALQEWLTKYPDDTCLIYSMWSGYKKMPAIGEICQVAKGHEFFVHSSGHVVLDDLNMLINKLNPDKIIFIHTDTDAGDIAIDLNGRILQIKDEEVITL